MSRITSVALLIVAAACSKKAAPPAAGTAATADKPLPPFVACMSNGVFVTDAAGCAFYFKTFDKWEKSAATCALDGDTFTASNDTFKYKGEMTKHGNVLADDQLWRNTPERAK